MFLHPCTNSTTSSAKSDLVVEAEQKSPLFRQAGSDCIRREDSNGDWLNDGDETLVEVTAVHFNATFDMTSLSLINNLIGHVESLALSNGGALGTSIEARD